MMVAMRGYSDQIKTRWLTRDSPPSQVVKFLSKTFPNRPLFGLGFSLGANMLTNVSGWSRCHGAGC